MDLQRSMTGAVLGSAMVMSTSLILTGGDLPTTIKNQEVMPSSLGIRLSTTVEQTQGSRTIAYDAYSEFQQYLDDLEKIEVLQGVVSKLSGEGIEESLFDGIGNFDIMELLD